MMNTIPVSPSRRRFLSSITFVGAAAYFAPGVFAEQLTLTPRQTEGPFYPDKLPLDTDNDLLIVNDEITPAVGDVTHLTGKILGADGNPISGAVVEIWQCDSNGAYIHSDSANRTKRDGNFQGFGRYLTDRDGAYYFRTIKPVAYPGRTPHIHFAVKTKKLRADRQFTTQCYIKGEPRNDRDGVLRGIRDAKQRESVLVDFNAIKDSKTGELSAKFDIVMGLTPRQD